MEPRALQRFAMSTNTPRNGTELVISMHRDPWRPMPRIQWQFFLSPGKAHRPHRFCKMAVRAVRHTLNYSQSSIDTNSHVPLRGWIVGAVEGFRVIGPITEPNVGSNKSRRIDHIGKDDEEYRIPSYCS